MNNTITKIIFALFFLLLSNYSFAQIEVLWLVNPSFEGFPRPGITPIGWENCGVEKFPLESPPDIHPTFEKIFGVEQSPVHGSTFMSMVVRENKSWESVGQTLAKPIIANQCYIFRIKLCQSPTFKSPIRGEDSLHLKDFTEPIVIRIWGGKEGCDKSELLAVSPKIDHENWLNYTFKFTPENNYKSIILEAYRAKGSPTFLNGNVLLDHASPLIPVNCDLDKSVIANFEWSQYEVGLNNLKTETDLKWYIARQAFYLDFEKTTTLSNMAKDKINKIVAALKQFPKQKLLFYFDGSKRLADRKRIKNVKLQLKSEGLPFQQYDVSRMKSKDFAKGWILKGNGFYITLMKIN